MSEKLPVDEFLKVVAHRTVTKTSRWWYAVVLVELPSGRKRINIYGWINRNGQWKRKQKLTIGNVQTWQQIKQHVEELLGELQ